VQRSSYSGLHKSHPQSTANTKIHRRPGHHTEEEKASKHLRACRLRRPRRPHQNGQVNTCLAKSLRHAARKSGLRTAMACTWRHSNAHERRRRAYSFTPIKVDLGTRKPESKKLKSKQFKRSEVIPSESGAAGNQTAKSLGAVGCPCAMLSGSKRLERVEEERLELRRKLDRVLSSVHQWRAFYW
jgi:hypothetical protein